jgi:hypothetical protein
MNEREIELRGALGLDSGLDARLEQAAGKDAVRR